MEGADAAPKQRVLVDAAGENLRADQLMIKEHLQQRHRLARLAAFIGEDRVEVLIKHRVAHAQRHQPPGPGDRAKRNRVIVYARLLDGMRLIMELSPGGRQRLNARFSQPSGVVIHHHQLQIRGDCHDIAVNRPEIELFEVVGVQHAHFDQVIQRPHIAGGDHIGRTFFGDEDHIGGRLASGSRDLHAAV